MTSSVCVLDGGGGGGGGWRSRLAKRELSSSETTLMMRSPRSHWEALLPNPPLDQSPSPGLWGAASGGATHETICTRRFPPRGPPPPVLCPRVSPGSRKWQVANLQSGVLIRGICDDSGVEGRLPHRGTGSRPSRHMLPARQLRPGWKPPAARRPPFPPPSGLPLFHLGCFSPVRGGSGDARGCRLRRFRQRRWHPRQWRRQTMEE